MQVFPSFIFPGPFGYQAQVKSSVNHVCPQHAAPIVPDNLLLTTCQRDVLPCNLKAFFLQLTGTWHNILRADEKQRCLTDIKNHHSAIVGRILAGQNCPKPLNRCCRYSSYYFNFTPNVFTMTASFDSMLSSLQFFCQLQTCNSWLTA